MDAWPSNKGTFSSTSTTVLESRTTTRLPRFLPMQRSPRQSQTHGQKSVGSMDCFALLPGLEASLCESATSRMTSDAYTDDSLCIPLRQTVEEEDPEKAQVMRDAISVMREVSYLSTE